MSVESLLLEHRRCHGDQDPPPSWSRKGVKTTQTVWSANQEGFLEEGVPKLRDGRKRDIFQAKERHVQRSWDPHVGTGPQHQGHDLPLPGGAQRHKGEVGHEARVTLELNRSVVSCWQSAHVQVLQAWAS